MEYVKQEKNFLAKLSGSRWIIRLLNSFQDKDNVYMVMPLAHGGMLHGLVQKRKEEATAAVYHTILSFFLKSCFFHFTYIPFYVLITVKLYPLY